MFLNNLNFTGILFKFFDGQRSIESELLNKASILHEPFANNYNNVIIYVKNYLKISYLYIDQLKTFIKTNYIYIDLTTMKSPTVF